MIKPRFAPEKVFQTLGILLLLAGFCLVSSCNKTAPVQGSSSFIVGKINPKSSLRQEEGEKEKAGPALSLRMGEATAAKDVVVCLPVEASGLTDILGFQFTMRFDSAALQYHSVRGFDLPGYAESGFGTRFADRGYLSTLWSDNSLRGVTKPANHKLFEVCFRNLQQKGKETEVRFADGPTYFEVVGTDMQPRRLEYANGKVKSK